MANPRPPTRRPLNWRSLLVAVFVPLLLGLAVGLWTWRDLSTPAEVAETIMTVPSGQRFAATADRLRSLGVISHTLPLRLWARWSGLDRQVRRGDFRFVGALTPIDALAILCATPNATRRVTIPEGTSIRGVSSLLAAAGLGPADRFLSLLNDPTFLRELQLPATGAEGYLFPDTYEFPWSADPPLVLRTLVQRFRQVWEPLKARLPQRRLSEHEVVTLASIIERETGVADERPLVAAVFRNRLRIGMRLQSDPTAVYGRADGTVPRAADLDVDSPYNTYLHAGLPPGPICNPGLASIKAALDPAEVPYLYFVASGGGRHEFSTNLDDHNRAVDRYRRSRP